MHLILNERFFSVDFESRLLKEEELKKGDGILKKL